MMKAILSFTLCLAGLTLALAMPIVHADSSKSAVVKPTVTQPPVQPPAIEIVEAAPPPPQEDPWFAPLRAHVEELSDASFDKPHTYRGLPAGEPVIGRDVRLNHFTQSVLDAVRDRAGELAQFGSDAAWKYAVTLTCIAHRETRISSNPSKLGDQDSGRAAGYWQIWERRDHADRFSAATALDMLIHEPTSSWTLPKDHPWTGYPECGKWLAAHPAP
jgi:hypothetical protein